MESKTAFAEANRFLAPVLHRETVFNLKGSSIIECLALNNSLKREDDFDTRCSVIQKGLDLLSNIQLSLESEAAPIALENLSNRKTLDGLLDLISVEGIYPFLSPGVGIPIERRVQSVLRAGFVTRSSFTSGWSKHRDKKLLPTICTDLYEIAVGQHLSSVLRDRTLVDLIAGFGELGYSPSIRHEAAGELWVRKLDTLLDRTPILSLFPILTSLLHPATPTWFRSPVATSLSLLPLRSEGVKNTINFIASSMDPAPQNTDSSSNKPGTIPFNPSLSLEVLSQSSKLLSSVPSSLEAKNYYSALTPQLLKLLDDSNIDTKRAAAYIISNGILGRRKYGAPGSIGWTLLAHPIIECFNPEVTRDQTLTLEVGSTHGELPSIIVTEDSLDQQLERLTSLVLLHPNPGLTKRLISPCLRQIWGLLCYSKQIRHHTISRKIRQILSIYFKTSVGLDELIYLGDNLLWEGDLVWTYYTGPSGGIGIQKRQEESAKQHDMIKMMHDIDSRVDEFLILLKSEVANDEEIGKIFAHTSKRWLLNRPTGDGNPRIGDSDKIEKDPLYTLLYAKLTQKILEIYKDKLAANPKRIIELVNQLLIAFIAENAESGNQNRNPMNPSLARLKDIAKPEVVLPTHEDSTEVVSISLSLISAIISSPEFFSEHENVSLLGILRDNLAHLASPKSHLPVSLGITAANILALLSLYTSSASGPETTVKPADPSVEDRKTHALALTYLSDSLPPVRAQGLSLLVALISKLSRILDIPSTSILLQSLLQDEDDFIYLSAINALGLLASRHSKTVVRMLLEQYIDVDENSNVDIRLRIGEALLKTIESLGTALVGEVAAVVGETMITVAGRRSQKPKSKDSREQEIRKEAIQQKEAEEAWDGPVPPFSTLQSSESQSDAQIVAAWNSPSLDDDPRIRASALSILGASIETNIAGFGTPLISTSIDLALSILKLEPEPDKSIIRRAAVLVIRSLVTAFERAAEERRTLGFEFDGVALVEVADVLRFVGDRDCDEVVRGHVRVVVEALEAWRQKSGGILGISSEEDIRFGLGSGGLRGLDIDPEMGRRRVGIEEVE